MGLLIKGGEIVTAETRVSRADIYIENETISRIGPSWTCRREPK